MKSSDQITANFNKLCRVQSKGNSNLSVKEYYQAKVEMLQQDITDAVFNKLGTSNWDNNIEYYPKTDGAFSRRTLDENGKVPLADLISFDMMIYLAEQRKITLSYHVSENEKTGGKTVNVVAKR